MSIYEILSKRCERKIDKGYPFIRIEWSDYDPIDRAGAMTSMEYFTAKYPNYTTTIDTYVDQNGMTVVLFMIQIKTPRIIDQ